MCECDYLILPIYFLTTHGRIQGGGAGGPASLFGPRCRLFNIGPTIGPPPGPPFFACRPKMDPPPLSEILDPPQQPLEKLPGEGQQRYASRYPGNWWGSSTERSISASTSKHILYYDQGALFPLFYRPPWQQGNKQISPEHSSTILGHWKVIFNMPAH